MRSLRPFDPFAHHPRVAGPLGWFEPFGPRPFRADSVVARMMREALSLFDDIAEGAGPLVEYDNGVLRIEMVAPGLDPEHDMAVELDGTILTVRVGAETEGEKGGRSVSRHVYSWQLGREVSEEDIRANYDAGILTVEVTLERPKDRSNVRRIAIGRGKPADTAAAGDSETAGSED